MEEPRGSGNKVNSRKVTKLLFSPAAGLSEVAKYGTVRCLQPASVGLTCCQRCLKWGRQGAPGGMFCSRQMKDLPT